MKWFFLKAHCSQKGNYDLSTSKNLFGVCQWLNSPNEVLYAELCYLLTHSFTKFLFVQVHRSWCWTDYEEKNRQIAAWNEMETVGSEHLDAEWLDVDLHAPDILRLVSQRYKQMNVCETRFSYWINFVLKTALNFCYPLAPSQHHSIHWRGWT